jgi:hypothetical protein
MGMMHLAAEDRSGGPQIDCAADPVGSLVKMFVAMVQAGRIAKGQCPALRPVFLKPHGVAHGVFRVRPDLPKELAVGLFPAANIRPGYDSPRIPCPR